MVNETYKITKTIVRKYSTLKCLFILLFTNCQVLHTMCFFTHILVPAPQHFGVSATFSEICTPTTNRTVGVKVPEDGVNICQNK